MKTVIHFVTSAAGFFSASPSSQRSLIIEQTPTDVQILNHALTLKHLEAKLYHDALENYTQAQFIAAGFPDPFYDYLREVTFDEITHVDYLNGLIGSSAVAECTYNFPATDVKSFVEFASVFEGIGASALLGQVASISNQYVLGYTSILAVETRHNALLRQTLNQSPTPKIFDTPLTGNEVYTLIHPYFVSCPSTNPPSPFKAYPTLKFKTPPPHKTADTVTLSAPGLFYKPGQKLYIAFITLSDPVFTDVTVIRQKGHYHYQFVIPPFLNGQVYFVLTNSNKEATDATIVAGPAIIEEANPVPL
ncbi:ferritin-like domain-containing protein [Halenospora varia]|nr:ferritin-like domain-containing protein [Halenospora varia]